MEDAVISVLVTSAITLMSLMAIMPELMYELLFVYEERVEDLFYGGATLTREGYPLRIEPVPKKGSNQGRIY